MQQEKNTEELISALVDGELQADEFEQAFALLDAHPQSKSSWHAYHVAGDVLRNSQLANSAARDMAFMTSLTSRLKSEQEQHRLAVVSLNISIAPVRSANWAFFNHRRVAGLAAIAIVATLAWQLGFNPQGADNFPQLADSSEQTQPLASKLIRDPRLDEFLAAHQQLGGASALQLPVGFIRNATLDQPSR